ncbi:MAG: F0F1 ATP synthase subunit gamma [Zetaproteobacteria bacterium]|nr:MAG: F0F1 ATP synthase subunit gamma [Zetaproteobacteria bacterium]
MASAKEIRGQIKAVQNTAKITKAMEMVAASKMRKAQDRARDARAYAEGIYRVIHNLMQAHPEYAHPFLVEREEVRRVGLVLITTDKGLCGGLNNNELRLALEVMKRERVPVDVMTIGRRGELFMRRVGANNLASKQEIPDAPEVSDILGVARVAMDAFIEGKLDRVWLVCNEFVNTMTQRPKAVQLLPCPIPEEGGHEGYWDYIYEPDSRQVLDGLLERYVESIIFNAVIENKACEHSARMVAMKAATDNANGVVKELRITYNKARQAAITQEIAEIVAGSAATS